MVRAAHWAAVAFLGLLGVAAAEVVLAQTATTGYRIGPKDLIEIRVFEVPELNIERRVAEEGTVNLPLIGDVPVQGLTDTELALRLKELLELRYMQRASVAVQVREFRSKPIAVLGAVKLPGNLAFSGRWTLLEALAAAGGLSEQHGDFIYVLRRADNGLSDQVVIRIEDLMVKGDRKANLPIFVNDLINVPATIEVTIFCLGEVAQPGAIVFKSTERITVLTAIARAGGLTDRASKSLIVKRQPESGGQEELTIDYRRILSGRDPDVALREGDVLVVKESFF